jgi:chromosome segregation ATPase
MADTPLNGETVTPEALENNANPVTTPAVNATDNAEVERLKKETEQKELRIRQLENEANARKKAEEEAEAKRLEEQNQYKTLFEQEKAKREAIEAAQAEAERTAALKAESDKLFSQYPEQVRDLALEAGMALTDTDEQAVEAFKAKLDKVSSLVKQPKVTANNPGAMSAPAQIAPQELHDIMKDPMKFQDYLKKNNPGIASMMNKTAE